MNIVLAFSTLNKNVCRLCLIEYQHSFAMGGRMNFAVKDIKGEHNLLLC